jgi:UDP-2,3-diacylglucosamine hydrolase
MGMRAIFLSDAHLKGPGDAAQQKLIFFLDRLRGRGEEGGGLTSADTMVVDHLVIAGDFFDFWFGRGDAVYPGFQPVIDQIAALKRQGVRVCLCEGNHDFFLGEYFTGRLGIEVYPEWAAFEIDGLRVLVSHGDTVDRGNRKYLALRGFLRSRFSCALQRLLPQKLLWRLARVSSDMSKSIPGMPEDRLAEIMHRFALGKFQEGYDAVILGHCHKPILREAIYNGSVKTFATLGDWIANDSYLSYDDGRFSMNRFSPGE